MTSLWGDCIKATLKDATMFNIGIYDPLKFISDRDEFGLPIFCKDSDKVEKSHIHVSEGVSALIDDVVSLEPPNNSFGPKLFGCMSHKGVDTHMPGVTVKDNQGDVLKSSKFGVIGEKPGVSGLKDSQGKQTDDAEGILQKNKGIFQENKSSWSQVVKQLPPVNNNVKFDYLPRLEGVKEVRPPLEALK